MPRLTSPGNYSRPEFGSKANTTMIKSLTYPVGSSKWLYRIVDKPVSNHKPNEVISGTEYKAGEDIEIEAGKYIGLYATDRSNRLKAYVYIKVEEGMIRRNATLVEDGTIDRGKDLAMSVVINGIDGSWKYVVSKEELANVFKDTKFDKPANFVAGQDIVVTDEDTVIDEDFKRFIYVFSTDKDGSIDKYYRFEVNRDNISLPPEKLEENINYIGPVMGDLDRTTKFTMLDSAYGFMYMIADKEMSIPALDANFSSKGISLAQDQGIEAKAGDYLLLLAVDDGKVKAYAQFKLTGDQIKGITPPEFTMTPEKGNEPSTTRVKGINLSNESNKWMYALGVDLADPVLDQVYEGAKNYRLGEDIKVELGQTLMILETDSGGRVKRFAKANMNPDNVKASLVYNLGSDKGAHLKDPIKGSEVGTIKFEFLKYEDYDFILLKSHEPISVPEMDSVVTGIKINKDGFGTEDIKVYEADDQKLRADQGFRDYAMVLAVDGDNKVKAYYSFELNRNNVKLPEAGSLNSGSLVNFQLTRGDGPNTTKVMKLDPTGLSNVHSFRYKLIDEDMKIEYNTIITGTSQLRENANVPGSIGKYLLILAVDSGGRTKYYSSVPLSEDNLRYPNAPILRLGTNFLEPVPGNDFNSTKLTFLSLPEGADKWMYLVLDNSYGPVEHNRAIEDPGLKTVDGEYVSVEITPVKANQWLLLLAVDDKGLVKAYYNQILSENHVKGQVAPVLEEGLNYRIEKGSKAGTTRFTLLEGWGLENALNTRWKYKLIPYGEEHIIPHKGSMDHGIGDFYAIHTDILVSLDKHEYILLLATDYAGRTKAYKYIKLDSHNVKEHANNIDTISLAPGSEIDTTQVQGLDAGKKYSYVLRDDVFDDYAVGDFLPPDYINYTGGDIKVRLNQYLTVFELDDDGNINRFRVFEIKGEDDVNLGKASLHDNSLLEGSIRLGGQALSITLDNGTWVPNIDGDPDLRDKLFRGLIANNQDSEWAKVITAQLVDRFNISQSGKTLEIDLAGVPSYDISEVQRISMIIDPSLVVGGINPILASGEIVINPTINANIGGDVVDNIIRAEDIRNGGVTIEINLVDGHWKPSKDMNLSLLWNGFEGGPVWSSLVGEEGDPSVFRQKATITRTSGTKLTIKLPPVTDLEWGYDKEVITLTINKESLVDATEGVVASPSFTIYPDVLKIEGVPEVDGEDTSVVWLAAPDGRQVREDRNRWRIQVTKGTLKDDLSAKDLTISGLPKNLVVTASKAEGNILDLVLSGTAATSITSTNVYVVINGTAVTEPDSIASNAIDLVLKTAEPMDFSSIMYKVDGKSLVFSGITEEMEYSTSINSTWTSGDGKDLIFPLEPMKVIVRERLQPKITKEFVFENGEEPLGITIESYKYLETGQVEVLLKGIDKKTMEYSINGGATYEDFEDLEDEEDIIINLGQDGDLRVRYKAVDGEGDAGKLPSKPTQRLNGIYLGIVELAAGEGKILNTTTNMEYSLGSTTGTDGIWTAAKANETQVTFSVGNKVWVRDKNDIKNFRYLGMVKQAEKPDPDLIYYSIEQGKIANRTGKDLEYRIAGGPWHTVWKDTDVYGVEFKPGELEFRVKAVGDVLASLPVKKATIPAQKSPVVVEIDDVKNEVLSINGLAKDKSWDSFEYRINPKADTPWNENGNNLKKEDLSGDKTVEIRLKATKYTLPSLTGVVKFTKNLDMSHVVLSDYTNPPVLNGTTNIMEYQIVTVESTSPWTKASNGNTTLPTWVKDFLDNGLLISISIRDSRVGQQTNVYKVVERTPSDDVRLNAVEYKFENKKIIFSNITEAMEYSLDNDTWTQGSGKDISFGDEPLSLYVRLKSLPYVYREFNIQRPEGPTGLELKVVDYIDEDTAKVEIVGFDNNMEYSLNGGKDWEDEIPEAGIRIGQDSLLIVRFKFVNGDREKGKLSSEPTKRLNTIFLGKVSIDTASGILLYTNSSMEYSTDSSNGTDGTWNLAQDPQTPISFKLGDTIWIREKGNPDHYRKVATIGQEPEPSLDKVYYSISKAKIHNDTGQNLEYRIGGGSWIKIKAGENFNIEFKPGALEFRRQANEPNLPSEPKVKAVIPEPDSPPTVRAIDGAEKIIEYFDPGSNSWKNIDDGFEYRIGANGQWKAGSKFTKEALPNSNIIVYVRKAATKTTLPSQTASVSFTENLDFSRLKLNVAKGVIENTTDKMEYSFDSTDGLNGSWTKASPNATRINFVEGMNIWFREIGKPSVNAKIVSKLQRKEIDPDIEVIYHVANGMMHNKSQENLQYRIGGGAWYDLGPSSKVYNVVFREGIVEIRIAATDTELASHPIQLGTIKAPASMPVVKYNDVENIIESIDGIDSTGDWKEYEYRIRENNNTTPWLPGENLAIEDLSGRKTVEIRRKADNKTLPSQVSTIEFYPNLQLDHVNLSTHVSPLELNGTTSQMDYRIWLKNGSNYWVYGTWTICEPDLNGNTALPAWLKLENIYKIEIRDRYQKENIFEIFP